MDLEWYWQLVIGVGTVIISALLVAIISWLHRLFNKPIVRVHKAKFIRNDEDYYFVKVINRSLKYDYTVTHIWIEPKEEVYISILDSVPPLPCLIKPSQVVEGYIIKSEVNLDEDKVYKKVKVRLSYGRVLCSKRNRTIERPGVGRIHNADSTDLNAPITGSTQTRSINFTGATNASDYH